MRLCDRVLVRQQLLLQVLADHHHRHMMLVFEIAEEAAKFHGGAARGIRLFRSAELDIVDVVALVAGAVDTARREQERADVRDRRTALGDRACILVGQRLAPALLTRGLPHGGRFSSRSRCSDRSSGAAPVIAPSRPAMIDPTPMTAPVPMITPSTRQERPHLVLARGGQRQVDPVIDGWSVSFLRPSTPRSGRVAPPAAPDRFRRTAPPPPTASPRSPRR